MKDKVLRKFLDRDSNASVVAKSNVEYGHHRLYMFDGLDGAAFEEYSADAETLNQFHKKLCNIEDAIIWLKVEVEKSIGANPKAKSRAAKKKVKTKKQP